MAGAAEESFFSWAKKKKVRPRLIVDGAESTLGTMSMARHLVADLSFLGLRPGVVQRQGSRTPCSYLQHYASAFFLVSLLMYVCARACVSLFLLLFRSRGFPCCGRTGRSGSTTSAALHISLTGTRSDDMSRLGAYFRTCTSLSSRSSGAVGCDDEEEGVWGLRGGGLVEVNVSQVRVRIRDLRCT